MNRGLTVLAVQTTFSKAEGRPLTDKVFPSYSYHFFTLKCSGIFSLCLCNCMFLSLPFPLSLRLIYYVSLSLFLSLSLSLFLYLNAQERCQSAALGWCVEFLQAFFLVADDAMDDSVTRRGHPCWFRLPEVKLVKNKYKIE